MAVNRSDEEDIQEISGDFKIIQTAEDTNILYRRDIQEISGDFRNIQIAEDTNTLYQKAGLQRNEDLFGGTDSHDTRPHAEVKEANKLHYIINCPDNRVIQVGKCCILVTVNFTSPLVSRLLDEGDVSVKLQSSDALLHIKWSNWDTKMKEFRSRIKIEIVTELKESKPSVENELIQQFFCSDGNYDRLREILNMIYEKFVAMVEKITGGCIELWVVHDTQQQLDDMRRRKKEMEELLTEKLAIKDRGAYQISITYIDEPLKPTLLDQQQGTSSRHDWTTERLNLSEKGASRSDTEGYASSGLKEFKENTKKTAQGESISYHKPDPPRKVNICKKDLLALAGSEMMGILTHCLRRNTTPKATNSVGENLTRSVPPTVLKDLENILPSQTVIDISRFKEDVYMQTSKLFSQLSWELNRMSAFEKEYFSEEEMDVFKARTKMTIEMYSRTIAAYARIISPFPQYFEGRFKEPSESKKVVPERKEKLAESVVSETMRLQREQSLQRESFAEVEFQKVKLDFYNIIENRSSILPLGTRVEPVSKRALLQSSLQKSLTQATPRMETEDCTYGTVVNHVQEDEEYINVHWDICDESFMYHETNVKELMRQVPRKIYKDEQVGIGVYVEKGAKWNFDDQNGPVGVGTVIRHDVKKGLVQVKWHGGVPDWKIYSIREHVQTRSECFIDEDEPV